MAVSHRPNLPPPKRPDPVNSRSAFCVLGLILIGWAPFLSALPNPYVYDDHVFVVEQPSLREGPILELFRKDFIAPHRVSGLYRPITALSYSLVERTDHATANVHRAMNIALHAVAGLLVFALGIALGLKRLFSFGAAAFFLVHPAHCEAVALVSGRSELLSSVFVLGALTLLLAAPSSKIVPRAIRLPGALAFGALGGLSKETALVLPVLVFLLDFGPEADDGHQRRNLLNRFRFLLFLGVVLATWWLRGLVVVSIPVEGFQVENPIASLPFLSRLPSVSVLIYEHVRLFLLPVSLSADYSAHHLPVASSIADPRSLMGIAIVTALLVTAVWLATRRSRCSDSSTCAIWSGAVLFLVPLAPVLNLVPIGTIFAERHAYLPSVGACLFLFGVFQQLSLHRSTASRNRVGSRLTIPLLLTLVLIVLAVRTDQRCRDFRGEESFYRTMVLDAPRSAKAHWLLANFLLSHGELHAAIESAETAVRIEPRFPEAVYGLAYLAHSTDDQTRAFEMANRCLELAPRFAPAHALIGILYQNKGDTDLARAAYRTALQYDPSLAGVREDLEKLGTLGAGKSP